MLGADNVVSAAADLLAFQHGVREQNLAWYDRAGRNVGTLAMPTVEAPIVGITNTFSDFNPCHGSVPKLIDAVKRVRIMAAT